MLKINREIKIFGAGDCSLAVFMEKVQEMLLDRPLFDLMQEKNEVNEIMYKLKDTTEPIDGGRIGDVVDIRNVIYLLNKSPFIFTLYGCCGQHSYDTVDHQAINRLYTLDLTIQQQKQIMSKAIRRSPVPEGVKNFIGMQVHMNFVPHEKLPMFLEGFFYLIADYPELITDIDRYVWVGLYEYSMDYRLVPKVMTDYLNTKTREFYSKLENLAQL
ncbi:MAG: hypothetical protein V1870_04080 [Candidatus Aenigmatarchaeota archaeon]